MPPSDIGRPVGSGLPVASPRTPDPALAAGGSLVVVLDREMLPAVVVDVAGELDAYTAPRLLAALRAALQERSPVLVVDLSAVEFMGSAGISVLAEAHQLAGTDTSLRIVAPSRAILQPLQITGMDTVLNLYQTRPDALGE